MNNNQGYYNGQNYNYNNNNAYYQQNQYRNQNMKQQTKAQNTKPMSFGKSVSSFWKNYGNIHGTASRSEFWKWFCMEYVIDILALYFAKQSNSSISFMKPATILGAFGIATIWWLAIIVPNWTLRVRRFKDVGLSKAIRLTLLICDDFSEFIPLVGPFIFYIARLVTIFFECKPTKAKTSVSKQGKTYQKPGYNYNQQNYNYQNYNNYGYNNQQNQPNNQYRRY